MRIVLAGGAERRIDEHRDQGASTHVRSALVGNRRRLCRPSIWQSYPPDRWEARAPPLPPSFPVRPKRAGRASARERGDRSVRTGTPNRSSWSWRLIRSVWTWLLADPFSGQPGSRRYSPTFNGGRDIDHSREIEDGVGDVLCRGLIRDGHVRRGPRDSVHRTTGTTRDAWASSTTSNLLGIPLLPSCAERNSTRRLEAPGVEHFTQPRSFALHRFPRATTRFEFWTVGSVWATDGQASPHDRFRLTHGAWGDNELDILTTAEGDVAHVAWNGPSGPNGGWYNGYESITGALGSNSPSGTPAIASWGPNRLDAFVIDRNNNLMHAWWDGNWHGDWENPFATDAVGDPVVISRNPGQVEVFYRTHSGSLSHFFYNGSSWLSQPGILPVGSIQ